MFHTSIFFGQDTGITELDVMTQVYALLHHDWFLWMLKLDVWVVLFGPGLQWNT
jgi:hypothetical protein